MYDDLPELSVSDEISKSLQVSLDCVCLSVRRRWVNPLFTPNSRPSLVIGVKILSLSGSISNPDPDSESDINMLSSEGDIEVLDKAGLCAGVNAAPKVEWDLVAFCFCLYLKTLQNLRWCEGPLRLRENHCRQCGHDQSMLGCERPEEVRMWRLAACFRLVIWTWRLAIIL